MYSTCLFCNVSLGANETIEHFPVGRRLAYDSATGRWWCAKQCARWNLPLLESRWKAIEEAERQFRATKTRVATDNIGLAKLSDGTELVRIGKPPELELAVWRYGEQFMATENAPVRLSADFAIQALVTMLPNVNRFGSANNVVEAAIKVIQDNDNISALLRRASNESVFRAHRFAKEVRGNQVAFAPRAVRLALEISLHADDERRAMEGELQQLEQRWRDAEAVAKISDEMFLPDSVEAQLRELRGDS